MKTALITFISITVIAIGSLLYLRTLFLPVSSNPNPVAFMINKGASVSQIGNNLEKARLIKNAIVFKFYIQLTNSQNKIPAGEFQLSPNLGLIDLVEKLKKGPSEIWVTIPEGMRREEIATKYISALNKDSEFTKEFLSLTKDKEGYLFPDTYLFPKTATALQIVTKMTSTFNKKIDKITYQELIMASLLERETLSDSEKPIVAGILYKRLKNDWPLQVDATLQFAIANQKLKDSKTQKLEKYWEPVYTNDKSINSPYNTYKNLGLPPTPIANPGLTSIEASINPEESDYWYYIHDLDGKIHFAKDLDEHNVNIRKYLN